MKLYLLQHGQALSQDRDPDRPLSPQGIEDVKRAAVFLNRLAPRLQEIWHSPKTRAQQTARLVAEHLDPPPRLVENHGLEPDAPVGPVRQAVAKASGDVLIAAHLPVLSGLVSELVIGQPALPVVEFSPGTLVCLSREEPRRWLVSWMLTPEILRAAHA